MHMPGCVASSNAGTVAPGRCTPWFEYPLVMWPSPEDQRLSLSLMFWQAMSCWLPPPPLSWPVTPELVAEPCDQYTKLSFTCSISVGWSPVGRPTMNGLNLPVSRPAVMMREVLLPLPGAPRTPWLESVAKRVPPATPRSKARPIAGPSGW